jgi:two-component system, NtrC family, response regulator HydG
MSRILLLDPDPTHRGWLRRSLESSGVRVTDAADSTELGTINLSEIDAILSNAELPSGRATTMRKRFGDVPLILFTPDTSVRRAVEAMQQGASDYFVLPLEPGELTRAIDRCLELRAQHDPHARDALPMVGHCPAMLDLFDHIESLARTESSLLILGESGSGKELVARAVHAASPRRGRPMICLNCATVPPSLIESELFGDRPGESDARPGLVEAAEHGTLFLDEVSALTPDAQTRLLQLLRAIESSGESPHRSQGNGGEIDVRLIAATHRDLQPLVAEGRFSQDLYVRLNTTTLTVPPLRERGNDIVELSNWLLQRICNKLSKRALTLSDSALQAISSYDWPGNVRELENALERAVILCTGDVIEAQLLAIDSTKSAKRPQATTPDEDDAQTSLEGYFVKFVLEHQDALTETELANKLGISRKSLWERRQRLNIPRKRTRTRAPRRDSDA